MRVWSIGIAAMFVVGYAVPADADWFHDFNDGQVPADWEFSAPPIFPAPSLDVANASSGYLTISESIPFDQDGPLVVRGLDTSESFSNVRVSATVNLDPSIGTFMGLTALNIGTGAYVFGIETAPSADRGTAWLGHGGPQGLEQWGSERDFGIPTRLDVNNSYFLEFDVVGNQLTGRVFDTVGGDELIRISQTIANPIVGPGFAGVFTDTALGFEHIPTGGSFDNVSAVAIPEPGSIALLVVGLAGTACLGARSRRDARTAWGIRAMAGRGPQS